MEPRKPDLTAVSGMAARPSSPGSAPSAQNHRMSEVFSPSLRLVFWETTAGCNLRCIHCRRIDVMEQMSKEDLSTAEGKQLIDGIAAVAKPILVFSGGEPLFRPDVFELAAYAKSKGLKAALATNGTLVDGAMAWRIKETGFDRVAISLDGAKASTHDSFRGIPGAHAKSVAALTALRSLGVGTQINFTVTRHNVAEVPAIYQLALDLGATALHFFMLVPVGCGVAIADSEMLPAEEYEQWLGWLYERELEGRIELKATCAPHYSRIVRQGGRTPPVSHRRQAAAGLPGAPNSTSAGHPGGAAAAAGHPGSPASAAGHPGAASTVSLHQVTRGCLAGVGVCFVSHRGEVFPCGYLPIKAGDVRAQSFPDVWRSSPAFAKLRQPDLLEGKCGACHFKVVCGGCRARAFAESRNWMAEEPFCTYQPRGYVKETIAAGA